MRAASRPACLQGEEQEETENRACAAELGALAVHPHCSARTEGGPPPARRALRSAATKEITIQNQIRRSLKTRRIPVIDQE